MCMVADIFLEFTEHNNSLGGSIDMHIFTLFI